MEQTLKFGQWLKNERQKLGLTSLAIAEEVGIDVGTISRLENEVTDARLSTAVRICRGLGVKSEELLEALQPGEGHLLDLPTSAADKAELSVLTSEQVKEFLSIFHENSECGQDLLVRWVSKVLEKQRASEEQLALPATLDNVAKDVAKLLALPGLANFYQFDLLYPSSQIKAKNVIEIYKRGGALISADIEAYIKDKISEASLLNKKMSLALSGITRRLETSTLDRVKLVDVLSLDKELGEKGNVLGIYWSACTFSDEITDFQQKESFSSDKGISVQHDLKLAFALVTISRWLGDSQSLIADINSSKFDTARS